MRTVLVKGSDELSRIFRECGRAIVSNNRGGRLCLRSDELHRGARSQISAAHEPAHLERAVSAFVKVGRAHGVV